MNELIKEARELCETIPEGNWKDSNGYGAYVMAPSAKGGEFIIAEARGWGYYTGEGEGGLSLSKEEAYKLQMAVTHFIARSQNLLPELCDALEKAEEQNKQLLHEVCKLACESLERDRALAKLEAEVEGWAKAEQEGRLVVLPCKVKENCFVVSHTDKTITEITVSEFSYSIWHDAWVVAAANGHQFFLDNAYRTRAEAEAALKGAGCDGD